MSDPDRRQEPPAGLVRQLGAFDSTMMMVGIVIGSGIFLTTGIMAGSLPSAGLILLAWLVGGLLTLAGALAYAELGALFPEAGGQYVYLREAYGPLSGFLFGWILFWVSMTGSIAALGVAFAEYFSYFFPALSTGSVIFSIPLSSAGDGWAWTLSTGQLVAVCVIVLLTVFNFIGVGPGKSLQNVVTVIKIGTLAAIAVLGLTVSGAAPIRLALNPDGVPPGVLLSGFGVALIAVNWAFDGWSNITYAAGEIRDPQRNLPFALIAGTLLITLLYFLVNWVYLRAMPVEEMAGIVPIAERATSVLFGSGTAGLVSAAVLISVLGALHGAIFVGPRVYYAMARDGFFFRRVMRVHPRFRTPGPALFYQAAWAVVLTVTGTFEQLFTFVMFVTIAFWTATAASVFRFRRKYPDMPRPYRTWGYPVVPLIFVVASTGLIVNTLIEKPVESLAGVVLALIGIPVYYYWKRGSGLTAHPEEIDAQE